MRGMDYQRALTDEKCRLMLYSYKVKQTIGIYSGTFDPIHTGHISFANAALKTARLDQVVFMPEPSPRNKASVTNITHRSALITAAIADSRGLSLLMPSSRRFNVVDTLPQLHRTFKGADLTLLLGSDVVKTFSKGWPELDILLRDVSLVIGIRDGDTRHQMTTILTNLENIFGLKINYCLIQASDAHAASSKIRAKIGSTNHLHPDVDDYIHTHNLYTKD
jgi:nicotinate-nucleotide adenylyltransferase